MNSLPEPDELGKKKIFSIDILGEKPEGHTKINNKRFLY